MRRMRRTLLVKACAPGVSHCKHHGSAVLMVGSWDVGHNPPLTLRAPLSKTFIFLVDDKLQFFISGTVADRSVPEPAMP